MGKASGHPTEKLPLLSHQKPLVPVKEEINALTSMAVQFSLRQMVRQIMSITDSAFQGHIGTKQLAGVSLANMYMGVPSTFIQWGLQAINTLASQAYGAGNMELVGIWLQTTIVFVVVGAVPVIVWYFFVGEMICLTMTDQETCEYGGVFAKIMAAGLLPQYLYGAVSTYFATQGVIMPATIVTCVTVVLNIFFNQFYIYGAFGWGGMGFVGSPLATVTSTILQLVLFMLYTVWWKQLHRETWYGWTWECLQPDRVKTFLFLAVPMGFSSVIDWGTAAVAGAFSGLLGPDIAACQSVLGGILGVAFSAIGGFSTSTQIIMARYLGAGQHMAAKRVLGLGSAVVMVGAVISSVLVAMFDEQLFRVWSNDKVILAMCHSVITPVLITILVASIRFLLTAVMNALSMANFNLTANNIGSWLVYIPLCYLMGITWKWGLSGFWWSDLLGEATKVVLLLYAALRVDWVKVANEAAEGAAKKDLDVEKEERVSIALYNNEALVGRTSSSFVAPQAITPSSGANLPSVRNSVLDKLDEGTVSRATRT